MPRSLSSAVLAALTIHGGLACSAPPIVSTFDEGAEGWAILDLACGNYASVLGSYSVEWFPTGGAFDGHIGRTVSMRLRHFGIQTVTS